MSWQDDVERELRDARQAAKEGNQGKVRTCARRAVGHAVTAWQAIDPTISYGRDFISQLRGLASDASVPEDVRQAADRLQARIGADFASRSEDPIGDAGTILSYVQEQLKDRL